MSFVVEDGTGLEDSNSYASVAAYTSYWTDRGAVPTEDQEDIEAALVRATDYLGIRFTWKGEKLTAAQSLDWPRACAYGMPTADYPCGVPLEGVPVDLERACIEYAKRALAGELAPDPTVNETGQVVTKSRVKAAAIEEEFEFDGAGSATFKPYPAADRMLRWLVVTTSGRVWRA